MTDDPRDLDGGQPLAEAPKPRVRVTNKRVIEGGGQGDAAPEAPSRASEGTDAQALARERAEARARAEGYLDDLRRLKAEFENYRKRMLKEQTKMVERASESIVERLLPILDNFELALMAADRTKDYSSMVRGVEIVYGELLELLHKEGLERIETVGHTFDPERHEAVMRADGDGEAVIVVEEMRPGYTLRGRVIRPAMVKVRHTT